MASNLGIVITAIVLSSFAGALLREFRVVRARQKINNSPGQKMPPLLR